MARYNGKFMTKEDKYAFLRCKKYISEGNIKKSLFWLDKIASYWHTPKEFTKTPNELIGHIKAILVIDSEITGSFREQLKTIMGF